MPITIDGTGTITGATTLASALTASSTLGVTGVSTFAAGSAAAPSITTTGDTNTGIFFPAADTIAFAEGGAEAMRIDSSGNVGIGTSTLTSGVRLFASNATNGAPATTGTTQASGALRIRSGNNAICDFGVNGTTTWIQAADQTGLNTNYDLALQPNGGNVGIGTSSPSSKLTVGGNPPTAGAIAGVAASGGISLALSDNVNNSLYVKHVAGAATFGTDSGGQIAFGTNGFTERMRIDSSGNVGIGTASPSDKLQVAVSRTSGTNTIGLVLSDNVTGAQTSGFGTQIRGYSNSGSAISAIGFEAFGGTNNDTGIAFYTQASAGGLTRRATIDSSGNLLVGTTAQLGTVTARGVFSSTGNLLALQAGNGSVGAYMTNASSTGSWQPFSFNNNGTSFSQIGSISCTSVATAYNTSSDYRLKNTIAPMTGALAKVALLKPCTYKWNVDGSDGQGFIAHELQEVAPYAVTGEKDGKQMQGVDYGKLTPILTAALQEAIAKIETLEARIAALEAK